METTFEHRKTIREAVDPWTRALLDECVKRAQDSGTAAEDVAKLTEAAVALITSLDNLTRL